MTSHPGADSVAEKLDEMLRGRAGPEPELHAVPHMLQRARRRLPFQFVHVHLQTTPQMPPDAIGHLPAGAYLASFGGQE